MRRLAIVGLCVLSFHVAASEPDEDVLPTLRELIAWGKTEGDGGDFWGSDASASNAESSSDQYDWGFGAKPTGKNQNSGTRKEDGLRDGALKETALAIGAQGGMAMRMKAHRDRLHKVEMELDRSFQFSPLMLNNGEMLPPVLSTSLDNTVISEDQKILRTAGQVFTIVKQARFVTVIPTWRDYLLMTLYVSPQKPQASLLPKSNAEAGAWEHWVKEGWQQGVKQADTIMAVNVAQLRRDLVGMTLYHLLLTKGMVSLPTVEKQVDAVGGDDENLKLNDRTLTISVLPKMRHDGENWRAIQQLPGLFGKGVD